MREHLLRRPGVRRLGRVDGDDAVVAQHVLPDLRDLAGPLRVIQQLGPVVVVGEPQLAAPPAGVLRLRELTVPDLVGVLDVGGQAGIEPVVHELREAADVVVVGQVRHAEPRIDSQFVGQFDHDLCRHAARGPAEVVRLRSLIPRADLGVVRVHPVHEPQTPKPAAAIEKGIGEPLAILARPRRSGHVQTDVAERVGRVGLLQVDHQVRLRPLEEGDLPAVHPLPRKVAGKPQPSASVEQQRVRSGREALRVQDDRGRELAVAEARRIAVGPELQRVAFAPCGPLLLGDPRPRRAEHIDERILGRVVADG